MPCSRELSLGIQLRQVLVFTFFLTSVPSNSSSFSPFYSTSLLSFCSFSTAIPYLSLYHLSVSSLFLFSLFLPSSALSQAMGSFYRNELKLPLSWWDRRPLFSLWHLFNVISDLVIIAGTLLKILLNFNVSDTSLHLPCHLSPSPGHATGFTS